MPPQEPNKEKREALFCNSSFLHDEIKDVLVCPAGRELLFLRLSKHQSGTYKVYAARGCQSCSFYKQCSSGKASRVIKRSIVHREREEMRERLRSEEGQQRYKLRGQTVEPVFGQMKTNRGLDRLLLRGIEGAKAELALALLAHNVTKCGKHLRHEATKALYCALEARAFRAQVQLFVVRIMTAITGIHSLLSQKHYSPKLEVLLRQPDAVPDASSPNMLSVSGLGVDALRLKSRQQRHEVHLRGLGKGSVGALGRDSRDRRGAPARGWWLCFGSKSLPKHREAIRNGWVSPTVARWDANTADYVYTNAQATNLAPYQGFFLKNSVSSSTGKLFMLMKR